MTARRQARAKTIVDPATPPVVLRLRRCIEIWADPHERTPRAFSAMRRWDRARNWWLDRAGIDDVADQCAVLPPGAPWSIETHQCDPSRSEALQQRLTALDITADDIPRLQREAQRLIDQAGPDPYLTPVRS